MITENVYIKVEDGNVISLKRLNRGNDKVIIVLPGFFQSKDTATFSAIANTFLKRFDVISVDMRGHGNSSGLYTFGSRREEMDLAAVLKYTKKHYGKIGVIAFSLSAMVAANYISTNHLVDSLVLISCPTAFEQIEYHFWKPTAIKAGLRGIEEGAGMRPGNLFFKKKQPIKLISKVSPIPLLLLHGECDPIISVMHSRKLYAKAKDPKELIVIKKGGHAEELFREHHARFKKGLEKWFMDTLS